MKKLLEQLKRDKKLCEIYRSNRDPDRFSVGYILNVDEQSTLIKMVSPYGEDDGYFYVLNDDVVTIQTDTEYLKDIEILIDYNKPEFKPCDISDEQILTDLVTYIKNNKLICTVELLGDIERSVSGIIESVKDNLLKLEIVEFQGIKSGYAFINVDEISALSIQSQDERKLQVLYNHKNRK